MCWIESKRSLPAKIPTNCKSNTYISYLNQKEKGIHQTDILNSLISQPEKTKKKTWTRRIEEKLRLDSHRCELN